MIIIIIQITFLLFCVAADCVFGVILSLIYGSKQEQALVRCRYLNSAGFLSQTSDFPHKFPLHSLKKMSKRQQSSSRKKHSGQTGLLHCCNTCVSAHTGREVHETRALFWVCGLQRPARCQGPASCEKPHRCLCSRKRSCSGLCKISLTFTSALWHLLQTWREHRGFAQLDLWPDTVDWVCVHSRSSLGCNRKT